MKNTHKNVEGRAPYSREEIIADVRRAAVAFASHLAVFGPRNNALDLAAQYLGCELDDYQLEGQSEEKLQAIPIERHFLYQVAMDAYDYAYQVGTKGLDYRWQIDERMHEVLALLEGFPRYDFDCEPSPLDTLNPQKLREVLETFMARYGFDHEWDLPIRDLALLARMGEAAVRTSLSKEGITTVTRQKGQPGVVPHEQAVQWLLGRRGFIPSAQFPEEKESAEKQELLARLLEGDADFPQVLKSAIGFKRIELDQLAQDSGIPYTWLEGALAGSGASEIEVAALGRLAQVLNVPALPFATKAIEFLLGKNAEQTESAAAVSPSGI